MTKIILNLGISRVSLISFILLCSVFTTEKAFSGRKWENSDMNVSYDQKNKSINFDFLFYEHQFDAGHFQYLTKCEFYYREKGDEKIIPLMVINTRLGLNESWIKILKKEQDDNILFSNPNNHPKAILWPDGTRYDIKQIKIRKGIGSIARMTVKWDLSESSKVVNMIHVVGAWKIYGEKGYETISCYYPVMMVK